ncbi:MAG TPA: HD domain-containing protein [Acidobacteriota bacterium]|nr:HD domain-containing protein [Acidobacteriota bacterium]
METSVVHWRTLYAEERTRLGNIFREDHDPDRYLEAHTRVLDELLQALARPFLSCPGTVLLASAGYGRREQFPFSDVDLVLVHTLHDPQTVEKQFGPLFRALWDARLTLGHQVLALEEIDRLSLEDFEFILALLDARYIAGDAQLAERILASTLPDLVERLKPELEAKILTEVERRHQRFNNTVFQLEPDVKEAPGGLRDLLAAKWLERLNGPPVYLPFSQSQIAAAHRFLKQLRIHLHLEYGRDDNRLTHELQETLAPHFGFRELETRAAVESLMKEYFWHAGVVASHCRAYLGAARLERATETPPEEFLPEVDTMETVLQVYQLALERRRSVPPIVRTRIQATLPRLSATIRYPAIAEQVLDFLHPRPGLFDALKELYELGVLELLFPEFGTLRARMIRDFYHRYTVDEHSLIAVRNIERLLEGHEDSDPRFAAILRDAVQPSLLTLSLLLHDVGKSRSGKHANESARLALRALQRFHFGREIVDTVVFLVRNHLAMSSIIFRRDLEDDDVVSRFADLVQNTERLRLLTLLTYADMAAVAPGILNGWKRDLLWQLYVQTYRKLTLGYGKRRIEEVEGEDIAEQLVAKLPAGLDSFDFEQFLEGFPRRYLKTFSPSAVYRHYRLASALGPDNPVAAVIRKEGKQHELVVITPDQKRLFARIVGLLSYFEMNILRATGFANQRQTILDVFYFEDQKGFFRHRSERQRFLSLLKGAVRGEISVRELLESKERGVLFRRRTPGFEPSIYFEDDDQGRYTILEIIAPDALGLLYRISDEIARLECDIELALISTEGDKAVDVFYLSHRGGKLSRELQAKLEQGLRETVAPQ